MCEAAFIKIHVFLWLVGVTWILGASPKSKPGIMRRKSSHHQVTKPSNRGKEGCHGAFWPLRIFSGWREWRESRIHTYQFLVMSIHFYLFRSISIMFYPLLSISLHFDSFLSISLQFLSFLSISIHFYAFLCIPIHFYPFLFISVHCDLFLSISVHPPFQSLHVYLFLSIPACFFPMCIYSYPFLSISIHSYPCIFLLVIQSKKEHYDTLLTTSRQCKSQATFWIISTHLRVQADTSRPLRS